MTDEYEPAAPQQANPTPDPSRRGFLKTGLAAAAAGGLGAAAKASPEEGLRDDLFLPEEHWKERMTAPDDGKAYGWIIDTRRCFGCHACEVACKAENDVPLGNYIRQTIYHDHERDSGQVARIMVPMACQHCEDAPCIKACPCGALHKGAGGSVQVELRQVLGPREPARTPAPTARSTSTRWPTRRSSATTARTGVDEGMDPACVTTCPSEALVLRRPQRPGVGQGLAR